MTNPTPLSPAAQAVLDAAYEAWYTKDHPRPIAAAALRAAAEQRGELEIPFAVIDDWEKIKGSCASFYVVAEWGYKQAIKDQRVIADELEAQ